MAVINNLSAQLTSFKVNDISSRLINCVGTYGTIDILNGGELLEDTLEFTFKVKGLLDHTIKSIVVNSLLLTFDGELCSNRNLNLAITDYGNSYRGTFQTNTDVKTIVSTEFSLQELQEENEKEIVLTVSMNSTESCYYAIQSLVINLNDIDYAVNISFTGPRSNRTVSSITAATLLINQKAESVTFSKDPTAKFDSEKDFVEGRLYLKEDGIYVDGYQYGTVAPATETIRGIVKLRNSFDTFVDEETGESGILAPDETGVAASTLLVYNAINTLKQYTDNLVDGIPAQSIELDDDTIEKIEEDYTFSKDFNKTEGKIYINWLEVN